MRALTDTEIKSLAPRVQSIIAGVWSEFKDLLELPEYKALSEMIDTDKFKIFLRTETGTVLKRFKELLVETVYSAQVRMNIDFIFNSTCVNNFSEASSYTNEIGDLLDDRISKNKKPSEAIFVYLDLTEPGKHNYVSSVIENTLHCPSEKYSLLLTIYLNLKLKV